MAFELSFSKYGELSPITRHYISMNFFIFILNVIATALAAAWSISTKDYEPFVTLIGLLGSLPFSFLAALKHPPLNRLQQQRHTNLRIATVGIVNVGKTVYLTVMLKSLLEARMASRRFRLIETEMIELLFENIKKLQRACWPYRTSRCSNIVYTGVLEERRHLGLHSTTLSFWDESGESFRDLREADGDWLHKTEYFRYVCSADVVLVFVDSKYPNFENYTAALQVLANSSLSDGVFYAPQTVAIIFTKADLLLSKAEQNILLKRAQPLLAAASNLFAASGYFFVSSTGPLSDDDPPVPLSPTNILEPIFWAISETSRAHKRAPVIANRTIKQPNV